MGCLTTLIVGVVVSCSWVLTFLPTASALGCFVCSSVNGSEPDCEDTFNNTNRFYTAECFAGRKGRIGVFPGTECIKLKARKDNYTVIVRKCTVDNGDLTTETEIGRENHCWMVNRVVYNGVQMVGCSVACNKDGCNGASVTSPHNQLLALMGALALLWTYLNPKWTFLVKALHPTGGEGWI